MCHSINSSALRAARPRNGDLWGTDSEKQGPRLRLRSGIFGPRTKTGGTTWQVWQRWWQIMSTAEQKTVWICPRVRAQTQISARRGRVASPRREDASGRRVFEDMSAFHSSGSDQACLHHCPPDTLRWPHYGPPCTCSRESKMTRGSHAWHLECETRKDIFFSKRKRDGNQQQR